MVCVPIAPHTIMARAFLTSPSDVVEIEMSPERPAMRHFFADGQPVRHEVRHGRARRRAARPRRPGAAGPQLAELLRLRVPRVLRAGGQVISPDEKTGGPRDDRRAARSRRGPHPRRHDRARAGPHGAHGRDGRRQDGAARLDQAAGGGARGRRHGPRGAPPPWRWRAACSCRGDDEDGTVVRRRVSADGRGRVELSGHMASVRELAARVGATVDLCGQHEHQRQLAVTTHVDLLDAWAGASAAEALAAYREALAAAEDAAAELERVREMGRATGARLDEAAFVLRRIDEVDPREGELEELEAQRAARGARRGPDVGRRRRPRAALRRRRRLRRPSVTPCARSRRPPATTSASPAGPRPGERPDRHRGRGCRAARLRRRGGL